MNILSILWSTCSTVAVMRDGEIIGCISEERLSRVKNDESYPKQAIDLLLKRTGLDIKDIDLAVFAGERFDPEGILCHKWSRFSIADRLKEQRQYWYPKIYNGQNISFFDVFKEKIDTRQYPRNWEHVLVDIAQDKVSNEYFMEFRRMTLSDHLGLDPKKIVFINHHRAHAYYAYYGSPMKKDNSVILTADAWGDDINASVSKAEAGNIVTKSSSTNFIIGRLYRYITLLLGMKPDEHEYKVMGLAAYAKKEYFQDPLRIFKSTMYVDNLGFDHKEMPTDLYFYFKDRLEGYRFDSIAGALQKYTEDILVKWTQNVLKEMKVNKICFGGGVAMNIKAVMEIAKLPQVEDIFINPSPSDESLAIGAAYVAMHDICCSTGKNPVQYLKPLKSAYLGPEPSRQEIKRAADKAFSDGFEIITNPDNVSVAKLIADDKIIGRCVGKSEFGARALGNRSIIANPKNLDNVKRINEKIKSRDFWMPFAPSILEDSASKYIKNPKNLVAPFMTMAFETKVLARKHLTAGLHQSDFTARPQIVSKEANVEYHHLLEEFQSLTGIGGVLNTSFNIHGKPIVQTPIEALDVFVRTNLDALILDGYLIKKPHK